MDLTPIQLLWFILIAVLWIGYLALEGFGFGVGMLLKILPKSEKERRLALNTIGPHWDGNEVWVLTAGGANLRRLPRMVRHHVLRHVPWRSSSSSCA